MKRPILFGSTLLAIAALLLWGASPLTLQPADTTAVDTWVRSDAPTNNYATAVSLLNNPAPYNILIKWDVSSIPAGATVTGATMTLWCLTTTAGRTSLAYPILAANAAWTEAATYNTMDGSNAWAGGQTGCGTSGTDHAADSVGSWTSTTTLDDEISSAITTSAVQAWVDGDNYGLVLKSGSNVSWHSSSSLTADYYPKLVITYTEAGGSPTRRKTQIFVLNQTVSERVAPNGL